MKPLTVLIAGITAAVLGVALTGSAGADISTPTITSSHPAPPANNNAPVLHGTAAPLVTVTIYTDNACAGQVAASGSADSAGDFSISVNVADNSETTFYASATDAGTTSACSEGFTYVEDSEPPPPPSITGHPRDPSNDTNPTFEFADDEPGVTFHCRLSRGPFPPCTSPQSYSSHTDGPDTFYVKAVDGAGNESASTSFSWTIDTQAPEPPTITDGPPNPSNSTLATFAFAGEDGASFRCSLDGQAFSPCPNPVTFTVGDGSHTLVVEAVDAAGNVSGPSPPFTWTVDTTHPLVSLTDKPPLLTNQTTADFSFFADPTPARYECALDGAGFSTCTSPQHYAALADGSHTFAVRAVSAGGSAGTATEYSWTVDTVPPQTTIVSRPPASSNSSSATFTFTSSEVNSNFACSINSAGFTPCTSPQTYSGLGDGSYTFRVQAVDAAGNADASAARYTWQISGVGPSVVDLRPPANVGHLQRHVAYRRLQLHWRRPPDADFDHVGVYVSTNPKTPPRKLVYMGTARSYTDPHFQNGEYYRYLVVSYDHVKNASGGTPVLVRPSALMIAPRNGSVVRAAPRFRWAAVRRASFYNIQLYTHGLKVLSTWPGKARQLLTRGWWYGGHHYSLRRGIYVWYVWPGFGPKRRSRYGPLLGYASFRVP
jgi:hypothetical protein